MKIIDRGAWEEIWTAQKNCATTRCGAVLLLDESDVVATNFAGPKDFHFVCPVCRLPTSISESELPPRLVRELNLKRESGNSAYWDR